MRAEYVEEKGRYMIYQSKSDEFEGNPAWNPAWAKAAKLMCEMFPKYQIVMSLPYDYGRSVEFAAVDMYRSDGRLRVEERYIFLMTLEWVRK